MMFSLLLHAVLPYPDPIPMAAPLWLFWCLLIVTFLLHLIPMNLVLGGSVIAVVARLRGKGQGSSYPHRLSQVFARWMPVLVAATITFGVAPLLFVQVLYGRLLYSSSILMGWFWLSVIPLLVGAYFGSYYLALRKDSETKRARIIAVLSSALFVTIGFIYTANMSLMLNPQKFLPLYLSDGKGLSLNLSDITIYPRFAHMLIGALAIAGLAAAIYGWFLREKDEEFSSFLTRHGLSWFVGGTALNFIVGTLFLLSYPRETLLDLVKNSPLGSLALTLGILLGLVTLGLGILTIPSKRKKPLLIGTCISLVLTLVTMILLRDQIRSTMLMGEFKNPSFADPQWGAIGIFLFLLVTALGLVVWMASKLTQKT